MSTVRPSSFPTISQGNYKVGEPIRADDWETLFEATHFTYAFVGPRSNWVFEDPATTTSTSYTTVNDTSGEPDLDQLMFVNSLERASESGGSLKGVFVVDIYGRDVGVRFTPRWADVNTDWAGTMTINSTSYQYETATSTFTFAELHEGSSTSNPFRTFDWAFEHKFMGNGTNSELFGISVLPLILSSSQLPTLEP